MNTWMADVANCVLEPLNIRCHSVDMAEIGRAAVGGEEREGAGSIS